MKRDLSELPIVDTNCRDSEKHKQFFLVRHTNGDYLMSLSAVLEVLYQVQRSDLQGYYLIIPTLSRKWWTFLGCDPKKFFCFDYCSEADSFLGMCSRILDPCNCFLIELLDSEGGRHTLSFECFISILYAACTMKLIPMLRMTKKDQKDNPRDWFEQAALHFRLPILANFKDSFLEISLYQVGEASVEVFSSEFFRTEDLKNA